MNRPDGDPAKTTTVAPGQYSFAAAGSAPPDPGPRIPDPVYHVVWWDPHALALDAGSSFGLRRDDLIAKDGDAAGSAQRLASYREWEAVRASAIADARQPSIVARTVTQIAADRDLWDLPPEGGSHHSEIGVAFEIGVASGFSRKDAAGVRLLPEDSIQIEVVDVGRVAGRPFGPQFGTLVHTTLATVPLDADESIVRRVASTQARIVLGSGSGVEEEAYAVAEAVMAVLRHPLFDQVRTASASGRCYRELPLIWEAPDGTLIEGTIDLAFEEWNQSSSERRFVVLDFKTNRELDVEGERYRRQLAIYCRALTDLKGEAARGILMRV